MSKSSSASSFLYFRAKTTPLVDENSDRGLVAFLHIRHAVARAVAHAIDAQPGDQVVEPVVDTPPAQKWIMKEDALKPPNQEVNHHHLLRVAVYDVDCSVLKCQQPQTIRPMQRCCC
jgi:hypothetical protein